MGSLQSVMTGSEFNRSIAAGATLEIISESWGPEEYQGRAWLLIGGKGAQNFGGHFCIFIDVGGHSTYDALGGEDIPTNFAGVTIQLGLFQASGSGKPMRVATPIIQAFDGTTAKLDHSLCEKIIPLYLRVGNDLLSPQEPTPRQLAYGIEIVAMEVFNEMTRRQVISDGTDEEYEHFLNDELEKAHRTERVDFKTPCYLECKRWDSNLNCHTYAYNFSQEMGFIWPLPGAPVPEYEGWVLDTLIAAPTKPCALENYIEQFSSSSKPAPRRFDSDKGAEN